jgi:putative ABC transport system permease protein
VRLSNVVRLYGVRLRGRLVQEIFALAGIAVGVALLFASQVASTSLDGSIRQIADGIVGPMRLQLAARSPQGFDERLIAQVRALRGVSAALPVLATRVDVLGPSGTRTVDLLGADPRQTYAAGPLVRPFSSARLVNMQALAMPAPIAQAIGVQPLQTVRLQVGERAPSAFVGATLSAQNIGSLVHSPIALGPLSYVQRLTGMQGRVTSIFVRCPASAERGVASALARLARANSLNLRPADFEATLFEQAASPTNQSTLTFSAISALVGFLFAFNAMLLTVAQRRGFVEDLRLDGYTGAMIMQILLFDALVLGLAAALVGLALGELLSNVLFSASPGYLSLGFPVGSQRIVTWQTILTAIAGGVLAAVVGVLAPLRREIFLPMSRARGSLRNPFAAIVGSLLGVGCLAGTTAILLTAPQAAIAGIVALMVALLALLPVALSLGTAALARTRGVLSGVAVHLAVIELRSRANHTRGLAVAATGAIAVFGSVAIQGAHGNLQRGLDRLVHQLNRNSQLWVIPPGEDNLLATTPFPALKASMLRHATGVRSVEPLLGALLDYGERRVWVLGMPPGAPEPIPTSQVLVGRIASAVAKLRAHGWAVLSKALAGEHHLRVGGWFVLPSPRPQRLRVAALITNLGWPPGAIIIDSGDYARAWGSAEPSAYYVRLARGASVTRARAALVHALGRGSGLTVESASARELRQRRASRQGLARLTQISWLVLIAAVLAMGVAMGSMIWQRRAALADLKIDGFKHGELWRALLLETALLTGAACTLGATLGIYGQLLLSHALATVTGFPVAFSADVTTALWSLLVVTAVAVAIVAVPGHAAASARPAIGAFE